MEIKTKQRLVGGLVLLALLAIFLPVLFHTSRPSTAAHLSVKIPPKPPEPQMTLSGSESNIAGTEDKEAGQLGMTSTPPQLSAWSKAAPSKEARDTKTQIAKESKTLPMREKKSAVAEKKKPAAQKAHKAAKPVSEKATSKAHANEGNENLTLKTLLAAPQAWVVQLGTFSEKAHVVRLIKKLRKKGFDAYMRPFSNAEGKHLFRVYVGPEIRLDSVKELRKKLQKKFHLNGVVKKYKV